MTIEFWITQILNALSLGALLFLVAAGLSLIFGVMRIVNLAHGSFYMLGTYITFSVLQYVHNQLLASLIAAGILCVLGALLQRTLIEHARNDSLRQMLLTFGILLVISDFSIFVWHGAADILPTPVFLSGSLTIGGATYPAYRIAVIAFGLLLALFLDLLQTHTRMGAIIRAGADDIEMLSCMGINVRRLFVVVFAACAGLAGIGGAVGGVFLGVYPGVDLEIGILAFVVVIVGGLGSIRGTLAASLLVALIDNLSKALVPEISMFAIFLLMVLVIAIRPSGLFGRPSLA